MSNNIEFQFHVPSMGNVDDITGVIRCVSLMTGNITAEGHDLEADDMREIGGPVDCFLLLGIGPQTSASASGREQELRTGVTAYLADV